jgi:membrane protein
MWSLGGLSWKKLAKRVYISIFRADVFGRAAQLSYYFLLALIPLLLFLTSLLGLLMGVGKGLRDNLFAYLAEVMPPSAFELIEEAMKEISSASSGGKLSFGLLAALWAASNGMGAITASLNAAYDVKETRPWWHTRILAILLTLALAVLIISALVLVLYGGKIASAVAGIKGFSELFKIGWMALQWPIILAFILIAFELIYYFSPNLKEQSWVWITPGSVIGAALWLLVSFAFRQYLAYFDTYSTTYGSLGAVIILMLWLYLTGAAVLIGGVVNCEIENAAAIAGDPSAREKGEQAPGDRERSEARAIKDLSRPL